MNAGMRLCVFGSRTLSDERGAALIHEAVETHKPSCLVTSAETGGVCKEARIVARVRSLPLKVYFLDFKFRGGAFERRSKAILSDCDFVLFIHDGNSQGTRNELDMANKMGVPYALHTLAVEERIDRRPKESQCELFL